MSPPPVLKGVLNGDLGKTGSPLEEQEGWREAPVWSLTHGILD